MIPPRARTWAPRGRTPVVRVPGSRGGRISVAGLLCYRPGCRSRLIYRLHIYRRRAGETPSFTWRDYRDLLIAARAQLDAPLVIIWDNLNRHTCAEMSSFIADSKEWLRIFQLPSYAPDLNPAEGIWAWLDRTTLANLTVSSLDELVMAMRRGLKQVQYRPGLIDGCLAETGLTFRAS